MDTFISGKSDPYIRIKIDGFKHKTRVISNNLNPI
jgi:Ca2+-dependent lipid-binding protein